MLIVKLKCFTLKDANRILDDAPRSTWSDGVAPMPLRPELLKGAKSGGTTLPKKGGKMRYTASMMRKFTLARCTSHHRARASRLASYHSSRLRVASHASHLASHASYRASHRHASRVSRLASYHSSRLVSRVSCLVSCLA